MCLSPSLYETLVDENNPKEIPEEAKLAALFKVYEEMNDFVEIRDQILTGNTALIYSDKKGHEEYMYGSEICVDVIRTEKGLDASVVMKDVGFDIWISNTGKGYHEFKKYLQKKSKHNLAAMVLMCEKRQCIFLFERNNIKEIFR